MTRRSIRSGERIKRMISIAHIVSIEFHRFLACDQRQITICDGNRSKVKANYFQRNAEVHALERETEEKKSRQVEIEDEKTSQDGEKRRRNANVTSTFRFVCASPSRRASND